MKTISRYSNQTARPPQQGGFVLVLVVFLIVVLAGAVVAISQLTVDTSAAQSQALQTTRAQLFNQSGLELRAQYLVSAASPDEAECALNDTTHADFPDLVLNVTCSEDTYNGVTLWTLTATSQSAGRTPEDTEYVWHRMTAVVETQEAP
ncbi:MAG: hypothetical protein LAT62_02690 [Natronospirillum sp.]|uniref:hypothetical protein n=1 Tax=Natronospirillum sp. TaxID=2812955 RepID=UPI0025D4F7A3|nr:hypothetical protein [Natronospirillum sp.]MCH8550814.1 hypothetical protein [Natronospirillum sp.]